MIDVFEKIKWKKGIPFSRKLKSSVYGYCICIVPVDFMDLMITFHLLKKFFFQVGSAYTMFKDLNFSKL